MHEINDSNKGLENAKLNLKEAQQAWKEIKDKKVTFREKKLLDLCPKEFSKEILENEHLKKKIIRNIKRSQKRKEAF